MPAFTFTPWLDLPLACLTVCGFVWNFNAWAYSRPTNIAVDLVRQLPSARLRLVGFFVGLVLLCWSINLALWAVFGLLLAAGLCFAMLGGDNLDGSGIMFLFAAFLIREWCFGFPQLILHPQPASNNTLALNENYQQLMGKQGVTLSPLRPSGTIQIADEAKSVVSETGELIDIGTTVVVSGIRNGSICVRPIEMDGAQAGSNE